MRSHSQRPFPKRHPRPLFAFVFLTAALFGCASTTDSENIGSVSVRAVEDTAWLVEASPRTSFEIHLVVSNRSSVTAYTDECRIGAQRLIDGIWQTVFVPACAALNAPITLFPGDSVSLRFLASATTEPGTVPQLDPRMTPGTYRAVASVWWTTPSGVGSSFPEAERESSTFTVAEINP